MLLTLMGITLIGQYIKQMYYLYLGNDATCVLVMFFIDFIRFVYASKGQLDRRNHTDTVPHCIISEESQV